MEPLLGYFYLVVGGCHVHLFRRHGLIPAAGDTYEPNTLHGHEPGANTVLVGVGLVHGHAPTA